MIWEDGSELGNYECSGTGNKCGGSGTGLEKSVESQGRVQGLETSCSDQKLSQGRHKVFSWTDAESTSSIWLTQSPGQSKTDAKPRSDRHKVMMKGWG